MTTRFRTLNLACLAVLGLAAGGLAALATSVPAAAATSTYTETIMGSLGGGFTVATAINASGQVTGYSATNHEIQVPCPPGRTARRRSASSPSSTRSCSATAP